MGDGPHRLAAVGQRGGSSSSRLRALHVGGAPIAARSRLTRSSRAVSSEDATSCRPVATVSNYRCPGRPTVRRSCSTCRPSGRAAARRRRRTQRSARSTAAAPTRRRLPTGARERRRPDRHVAAVEGRAKAETQPGASRPCRGRSWNHAERMPAARGWPPRSQRRRRRACQGLVPSMSENSRPPEDPAPLGITWREMNRIADSGSRRCAPGASGSARQEAGAHPPAPASSIAAWMVSVPRRRHRWSTSSQRGQPAEVSSQEETTPRREDLRCQQVIGTDPPRAGSPALP